ncbi:MAG: hypothetical protein ACOYOP_00710 [Microthrixaceae bacterium]
MSDQSVNPQGPGSEDRIEQFRSDIGDMKLKGGSGAGEKWFLILGVLLMVVGVVLAVVGAIQVGANGGSPADQRAYMAQGSFLGIALIIVGAALFVRYSLARYLRFWLIRLTYEQRSGTDRLVAAIERAAGLEPAAPAAAATTPATAPAIAPATAAGGTTPPPYPQG